MYRYMYVKVKIWSGWAGDKVITVFHWNGSFICSAYVCCFQETLQPRDIPYFTTGNASRLRIFMVWEQNLDHNSWLKERPGEKSHLERDSTHSPSWRQDLSLLQAREQLASCLFSCVCAVNVLMRSCLDTTFQRQLIEVAFKWAPINLKGKWMLSNAHSNNA